MATVHVLKQYNSGAHMDTETGFSSWSYRPLKDPFLMHASNVRDGGKSFKLKCGKGKKIKRENQGKRALLLLWLCVMTVWEHEFKDCVSINLNRHVMPQSTCLSSVCTSHSHTYSSYSFQFNKNTTTQRLSFFVGGGALDELNEDEDWLPGLYGFYIQWG